MYLQIAKGVKNYSLRDTPKSMSFTKIKESPKEDVKMPPSFFSLFFYF